ncbi:hypothetical protein [Saccharibacillus sacchari]|uniref:Uncharacterized protein n=1 Tax=Saccharibacillus sacchari TaxID=456493 RepID=A0ACC6P9I5_9BACL
MRVTIDGGEHSPYPRKEEDVSAAEALAEREIVFRSTLGVFLFPFLLGTFILRFMFFFAGWTIVATGYVASLSAASSAGFAFVLAWTNGQDAGASLLAGGCGLALLALCRPFFGSTEWMRDRLLKIGAARKASRQAERRQHQETAEPDRQRTD